MEGYYPDLAGSQLVAIHVEHPPDACECELELSG